MDSDKELAIKALKAEWCDICNQYLKLFCEKHEYTYEPYMWVGDEVGGIIEVCDMFVNFDDIRYDVDNDVPEDYFAKWYWKGLEVYQLTGKKYMNYPSFCKGAPDEWTEERMQAIREMNKRIEQEKEELQKLISGCKEYEDWK